MQAAPLINDGRQRAPTFMTRLCSNAYVYMNVYATPRNVKQHQTSRVGRRAAVLLLQKEEVRDEGAEAVAPEEYAAVESLLSRAHPRWASAK